MSAPSFKNAHQLAKQLMDEDFYYSATEESAPFGNDDGADTFAGFSQWRLGNTEMSPLVFLGEQLDRWGYPNFEIHTLDQEIIQQYIDQQEMGAIFLAGIDAAIIAIAFAQLYFEGTIEEKTCQLAKIAISRQLIPELIQGWDLNYQPTRQEQLTKMLSVLNRV